MSSPLTSVDHVRLNRIRCMRIPLFTLYHTNLFLFGFFLVFSFYEFNCARLSLNKIRISNRNHVLIDTIWRCYSNHVYNQCVANRIVHLVDLVLSIFLRLCANDVGKTLHVCRYHRQHLIIKKRTKISM